MKGPNTTGGLCECGCGLPAPIAKYNDAPRHRVKGKSLRFVQGHHACRRPFSKQPYIIDPETGCWIWQRAKAWGGYGRFRVNGQVVGAHVYYYEQKYGPVPDGMELDHVVCDTPACCNPDHVRPTSHAMNIRRATSPLTAAVVRDMRRLWAEGSVTHRQLATAYGIHINTVRGILSGKRWQGVSDE